MLSEDEPSLSGEPESKYLAVYFGWESRHCAQDDIDKIFSRRPRRLGGKRL